MSIRTAIEVNAPGPAHRVTLPAHSPLLVTPHRAPEAPFGLGPLEIGVALQLETRTSTAPVIA